VTDFEPVGGMTAADIERIKALINPTDLSLPETTEGAEGVRCLTHFAPNCQDEICRRERKV
jgi:hypothetical protein